MHNLMAQMKSSANETVILGMPKESIYFLEYFGGTGESLPDIYMLFFVMSCDKSYLNLTSKTSHLLFNLFYDIANVKSVLAVCSSPV